MVSLEAVVECTQNVLKSQEHSTKHVWNAGKGLGSLAAPSGWRGLVLKTSPGTSAKDGPVLLLLALDTAVGKVGSKKPETVRLEEYIHLNFKTKIEVMQFSESLPWMDFLRSRCLSNPQGNIHCSDWEAEGDHCWDLWSDPYDTSTTDTLAMVEQKRRDWCWGKVRSQ